MDHGRGRAEQAAAYLLTSDGFHLLLDLGGGALGRLQEHIGIADIGAVCVSHAHHDHYADLFPLSVARYWGGLGAPAMQLLIPLGFYERVSHALMPGTEEAWSSTFDMRTLSGGDEQVVGPFSIRAFDMAHVDASLGFRVSADGIVLAYTGDTGPADVVSDLAAGADIFLAEATHIDGGELDFHLTARQAARYAVRGRRRVPRPHPHRAGGRSGGVAGPGSRGLRRHDPRRPPGPAHWARLPRGWRYLDAI